MRCLVTGAGGFIGGAVVRALRAAGHEAVAYVHEGSDADALAEVERVAGDVNDPNRLANAASGCEALVHAAGLTDPAASKDALGWAHVAGTENALKAAKEAGCKRMVHISCADVTLHDGPRSFWNEDQAPTRPFGDLAQTKLQAEELVRVSGQRGFWTCALRPALVWGPGDTTHLPRWKAEAESGGIRLVGGGKKLLATTFVDNLAQATLCALQSRVTTGNVYSVVDTELSVSRELFTELSAALGWPPPKNIGPYRWAWFCARLGLSALGPVEVIRRGRSSAFDASRAKQDLGFEPSITREQGMQQLASWYQAERGVR